MRSKTVDGPFLTLGKILVDDKPLKEYSLKENDFLVVMVTKVIDSCVSAMGLLPN
jgi:hypothetical protein